MAGRAQPPSAAQPCHLTPLLPGLRGRSAAAATGLPPPPFYSVGSQHSPPSATILHEMFNTCVEGNSSKADSEDSGWQGGG